MYPKRKAIGLFIIVAFLTFSIVGIASFVRNFFAPESVEYKIISPLADPIGTSRKILGAENSPLAEVVARAMEGTKGTYAIAIKHLTKNTVYYEDEHKTFDAASLYKLWVMAVVFEQIEIGKIDINEKLHEDIKELNERFKIPTESAELTEGEINMTVSQALSQMITISHNYAALTLSKKVGLSNITKFLKEYGFMESSVGTPPKTTAYDIALFFEKLYSGEIISKDTSAKMIELLKKQQLNDRIPKYLPDSVAVAHKTGEIDYFKHDAGIVFSPKGDYVLVVLSESNSPQGAAERLARLSRRVFDYFQR